LESKSAALVAAVFVDFPTNKCNFLHKNKLAIVRRIQFFTGRRYVMSFSRGAVATVALWKSAPVIVLFFSTDVTTATPPETTTTGAAIHFSTFVLLCSAIFAHVAVISSALI